MELVALEADPTSKKAELFLKDAEASVSICPTPVKGPGRSYERSKFDKPVSNFELSVRVRKGLESMGIVTLGDLCSHTEKELLSVKNFGESSLEDIKKILEQEDLHLGQVVPEPEPTMDSAMGGQPSDAQAALLKIPVSDLNLTVRARRCLTRKGIEDLGQLVQRTAEELLNCKNFGQTSLKEIQKKLAERGLKLRND